MKHLGNGRFQDADGRVYQWDGPDQPPPCSKCEEELADGRDGLCSFCREDAPRPTPPPAAPARPHSREQYLAKFRPELRAELEACRPKLTRAA